MAPSTRSKSPRLSANVRPLRYRLAATIHPGKKRFSGQVEIELQAPVGTRTLELHSADLDLSEVEVLDRRGPIAITQSHEDAARERVAFKLRAGTRSPEVQLRIRYSGPLREDLRGLYAARSGKRRYAATQLEAADARRFFPCFDEPDKKARFRLSITVPQGMQAISNAPVERRERNAKHETLHFAETPPLSTYLVAVIVGELEGSRTRRAGKGGTPIRIWAVPGRKAQMGFALEAAAASLERLERYFGLPYPYAKLDLIAVPDFEFGAMENAGAVTFRESLLLVDPKTISHPELKRVAEVIAHELAHMWFGDLVTMAWWDDLWLNEAFATWMAYTVVDDWHPEWNLWLDFQQSRASAFGLDALANTHAIYTEVRTPDQATENFDLITYEKGASVVRMVERWLGPKAFQRGVRRYIRQHREGNARAADLWGALEQASGQPVEPVVWSWISRPGFPMLFLRRAGAGLELEQRRYFASPRRMDGDTSPPWPIPVVLRWAARRGRPKQTALLIDAASKRVDLAEDRTRFVYGNAEESGFYRTLHDRELLSDLQEHWSQLADVERMGLIQHQWAGVRARCAPLDTLLALIDTLGAENEPEVLKAAYIPLAWLHQQVVPLLRPDLRAHFAAWIRRRFGPAFQALGFEARRREDAARRARRAILLQLLGEMGEDAQVVTDIDGWIGAYLRDRSAVDANLATPLVRLAARNGGKRRYDHYVRAVRSASTPQERSRFELALGDFTDPTLVARTLDLLLTPLVPTQDVVLLLGRLLDNPSAREATFETLRARWDAVSPRISTGLASRLVAALPALQTRAHRKAVAEFFRAHPLPSAARALKQALERFDLDAELRKRLRPELVAWLRQNEKESAR